MTVGLIGFDDITEHFASRLIATGISIVAFDESPKKAHDFVATLTKFQKGYTGMCLASDTFREYLRQIPTPRVIVLHLSDSKKIDSVMTKLLAKGFSQGDTLIDTGKSEASDTISRYQVLREKGCAFIDCGILLDAPKGRFSLCLGGDVNAVKQVSWLWDAVAGPGGWKYAGRSGNGHYTAFH